ncbi:MAG: stalk domain-containing protein [bacterium]
MLEFGDSIRRIHLIKSPSWRFLYWAILLAIVLQLLAPGPARAASHSLEITGEGVANPVTFTRAELEEMEQHQYTYSTINTWPTKKWQVGRGVKLWDLLERAGIKEEATFLKFTAVDGFTVILTAKELFQDKRYCFPHFQEGGADDDGHMPGSPAGKVEVEPMVVLLSVEGSDNPEYMNELHTLQLMLGQRAVTEQTGNLFVKYLCKIEVFTGEPPGWDPPQANPPGGTVPRGSMVTLSNLHSDDDKIYYTTDGSTPTIESPMYNWIASRWWSARADVLGTINRPIGPLEEDTVIKAVTIGPGRLDSEVVTFHYRVVGEEPAAKTIILTIGREEALLDGAPSALEAAPYIKPEAGRTLVPVRFVSEALKAQVGWDPDTKQVTITAGEKEVILTIGSSEVSINGRAETIDCPPEIVPPGRTFVPIRFVSEILGAEVDYNPDTRQVIITS